jgi:hypothetical protein
MMTSSTKVHARAGAGTATAARETAMLFEFGAYRAARTVRAAGDTTRGGLQAPAANVKTSSDPDASTANDSESGENPTQVRPCSEVAVAHMPPFESLVTMASPPDVRFPVTPAEGRARQYHQNDTCRRQKCGNSRALGGVLHAHCMHRSKESIAPTEQVVTLPPLLGVLAVSIHTTAGSL